jgi:hypothetical protein
VKQQALAAFRELPGKLAPKNAVQILAAAGTPGSPEEAGKPNAEGQRALQLKKMLTDKVRAEPAATSRLVESWVKEDKA